MICCEIAAAFHEALHGAAEEFCQVHQAREGWQHHSALDARNRLRSDAQGLGDQVSMMYSITLLMRFALSAEMVSGLPAEPGTRESR